MYDSQTSKQFAKFIVVGISNTLISFITFTLILNYVLIGAIFASQCISYAAGVLWSFIWNRRWTFETQNDNYASFLPFITSQVILLFVSAFLLERTASLLDWNINYIWILVMGFITIVNFLVSKFLVFETNHGTN